MKRMAALTAAAALALSLAACGSAPGTGTAATPTEAPAPAAAPTAEPDNIHVDILNAESGELVSAHDSKDFNQ